VMVLDMLGIEPDRPPSKETFAGLDEQRVT
jgi:hypothetical protein